MTNSDLSFIRDVLYGLKRDYGVRMEVYSIRESVVDLETGQKTVEKDVHVIRRAILLPQQLSRSFSYDLSYIAANKNFTYGGTYDKNKRTVILDPRDLPKGFLPGLKDYCLIDHTRYNIKDVDDYTNRQAVLMTIEAVLGENPSAIISQSVTTALEINSGTNVEE